MEKKQHNLYVIGAGLPRTGTFSLKAALEKVLPGNCMHGLTVWYGDLDEVLNDVFNETSSTDESVKGYMQRHNIVAAIDCPIVYQYKRAMRIFPNAKVILTVREPSTWVKSYRNTIYAIVCEKGFLGTVMFKLQCLLNRAFSRFVSYLEQPHSQGGTVQSIHEGRGEQYFEKWNEEVKNYVPTERLLVFNVKEGWEPLCKFLDVPIPDEPFPRVNSTEEFNNRMKQDDRMILFRTLGIIVVASGIGCVAWKNNLMNKLLVKLRGFSSSLNS